MIFLTAKIPNVSLNVYGAVYSLEPIEYPEVNTAHILVMENELAQRTLNSAGQKIQKIDFNHQLLPGFPAPLALTEPIPEGSRILIVRGGGIGDVLMCLPAIRELKKRLPAGVRVSLSTFQNHSDIFSGQPDLDAVLPQPLPLQYVLSFDYLLEFNDPGKLISRIHMTDFYLTRMGIDPSEVTNKQPSFPMDYPFDNTMMDQLKYAGRNFKCTVYLNGIASDRLRDIRPELLASFPEQYPHILFVVPEMYTQRYPQAARLLDHANIFHLDTTGGLPRYVTAIARCDLVVTTDSSAYHIASSLDKPCLALFGPISPSLRTTYYPKVIELEADYEGDTCKSPCGQSMYSAFYGGRTDQEKRCPEAVFKDMDFSPCLSFYSSQKLFAAFDQVRALGRIHA